MGLLVDGVWRDEQHGERAPTGRFLRPATRFRNWVTEDLSLIHISEPTRPY